MELSDGEFNERIKLKKEQNKISNICSFNDATLFFHQYGYDLFFYKNYDYYMHGYSIKYIVKHRQFINVSEDLKILTEVINYFSPVYHCAVIEEHDMDTIYCDFITNKLMTIEKMDNKLKEMLDLEEKKTKTILK